MAAYERPVPRCYIVPAIVDSYSIDITPRAEAIARSDVRAPPITHTDASDKMRSLTPPTASQRPAQLMRFDSFDCVHILYSRYDLTGELLSGL
jgi:hypothetical protein